MRAQTTTPFTLSQVVLQDGEGLLRLLARVPGCDWSRLGAESGVASILVSGQPVAELVLHRGEALIEYTVALGPLRRGSVEVQVVFRPDLSPAGAHTLQIHDAHLTVIPKEHPDYVLWRYAPRLYGRLDNAVSDTPLLLLARYQNEGAQTRLAYAFVWSDQDTDRSIAQRMAQDGTPVDIDWVYELVQEPRSGRIVKAVVQGAGESTNLLAGLLAQGHPVLRTTTRNNMVAPARSVGAPLLFALTPAWAYDENRGPRERALDAYPWALELAMKESQRQPLAPGEAPFDPRQYLYTDFQAQLPTGGLLAVEVGLRDGRRFVSDKNSPRYSVGRSGWSRVAVALPPGVGASQLAEVRFVRRDRRPEPHTVQGLTLRLLNERFEPQAVALPRVTTTVSPLVS